MDVIVELLVIILLAFVVSLLPQPAALGSLAASATTLLHEAANFVLAVVRSAPAGFQVGAGSCSCCCCLLTTHFLICFSRVLATLKGISQ